MKIVKIREAILSVLRSIQMSLPILVGVLLLVGMFTVLVPGDSFAKLFSGNAVIDPLVGALLGSAATGNPVTSYVIGGELLSVGVSISAVIAFILSWVTVGLVQLPAESLMLSRRFAITRNLVSYGMAVVVAALCTVTAEILPW
jgi:hypothetical protein